jgi:hypothetical protein
MEMFFVIAMMSVLFLAMAFLTFKFALNLRLRQKLKKRGERAAAKVVQVKRSGVSRRGKRSGAVYDYTLEFMVGDERRTCECSTTWRVAGEGDAAEVAYLPEDPGQSLLVELLSDSYLVISTAILAFVTIVLAFILFFMISYQ